VVIIEIMILWNMAPCILICTSTLEEPAASIFRVRNRGKRILRNCGTCLPSYLMSHARRQYFQLFSRRKENKCECSETKDMTFLSLFTNTDGQDNIHSYFLQSGSAIHVRVVLSSSDTRIDGSEFCPHFPAFLCYTTGIAIG
jgi:hypothetical protein